MNTGQIIKSRSTERFTSIPNEITQSKILSFEERGLLIFLLSLPSDWCLYKTQLSERTNQPAGTIDRVWKSLQKKGYILSVKVLSKESGRFEGWNHIVYDAPTLTNADVGDFRESELPTVGNPDVGETMPIQKTKEDTKPTLTFEEKYKFLIDLINKTFNRKFLGEDKSRAAFRKRLKEGYTYKDFKRVVSNIQKDEYHAKTGYKYATPEFITRPDKIEMFNQEQLSQEQPKPKFDPLNANFF